MSLPVARMLYGTERGDAANFQWVCTAFFAAIFSKKFPLPRLFCMHAGRNQGLRLFFQVGNLSFNSCHLPASANACAHSLLMRALFALFVRSKPLINSRACQLWPCCKAWRTKNNKLGGNEWTFYGARFAPIATFGFLRAHPVGFSYLCLRLASFECHQKFGLRILPGLLRG